MDNRYLLNIPSKSNRIHILLKCTSIDISGIDHIWATNEALVNLRKLKSYQASFLTTMLCKNLPQERKYKKHKHMKAKQYATTHQWLTE